MPALKSISINLGDVRLTIPAEGYLIDLILGHTCVAAIANSGSNNQPYILGDTFIRSFYIKFDYRNNNVAFAVSSNAVQGTSVARQFTTSQIILISLATVLGTMIIAFIAFKVWKRCKT